MSLVSHDPDCKKMMGLALKNVNLTLLEDNKAIFTEQGEMLPREVIAEKIRLALGLE